MQGVQKSVFDVLNNDLSRKFTEYSPFLKSYWLTLKAIQQYCKKTPYIKPRHWVHKRLLQITMQVQVQNMIQL